MASGDDRKFTCNCFGFYLKPKKAPRVDIFPPLTEEELVEPVSPVDERVHGRSVFPTIANNPQFLQDAPGPSGVQNQPEIMESADAPGPSGVQNQPEVTESSDQPKSEIVQEPGDDFDRAWNEPDRHTSATRLGFLSGQRNQRPQPLAPDVLHALNEYEKVALQQSLERADRERIERENQENPENVSQAPSSNPALPSDPEEPRGRACSRCAAVGQPRLNSWSDICGHFFCDECLMNHLGDKIENRAWNVKCPAEGCAEMKTAEECRRYLPKDVGDHWVQTIPEEARKA